jgi:hypothetical protein
MPVSRQYASTCWPQSASNASTIAGIWSHVADVLPVMWPTSMLPIAKMIMYSEVIGFLLS